MNTEDAGDSTFTVYATVDMADAYADGASHADDWRALTDDDQKGRLLVTATRVLDRQRWRGDKAAADQPLAFPRVNMNLTADPVVDANGVPMDIVNAAIELAFALSSGSELQDRQTTVERVRSMSAGGVSITNFRGIDPIPSRFPQIVQELIRPYFGGSSAAFVAQANGTDQETIFPIDLGYSTGGI